jgi:hypothetical protein
MTREFARFACIDWSGEAVERPRGIAIAQAVRGTVAPFLIRPTGGWSREAVLDWLMDHAARKSDLVIGVDCSFSLPFADRGGFFPEWPASPADAHGLWALIDSLCTSDAHLGCASFIAHEAASRHFRRHRLGTGDLFEGSGGRLRRTERLARAAGFAATQSSFNLVGAAQVGKSSLTAMRLLNRLRGYVPVWPFDPIPESGPLLVEIYTAVAAHSGGLRGRSKVHDAATLDQVLTELGSARHEPFARYDDHSTDAMLGAAWLRTAADNPNLWHPAGLDGVAATEGWTFGVG